MKKIICLAMVLLLVVLTACGSYGAVSLQDTMEIPSDGIIEEGILAQLKKENAIGTFYGSSNGLEYEWTIFGSDIEETAEINLSVESRKNEDGLTVVLGQEQPFGFSALLSVYLDEVWSAQSATAYAGETPVASVSLTGNKQTILNLNLDGTQNLLVIRPDAPLKDAVSDVNETVTSGDSYLSQGGTEELKVYTDQTYSSSSNTEASAPKQDDSYTSSTTDSSERAYSDGTQTGQDDYLTDPVPAGKPLPVEPEDQNVDTSKTLRCTFSIECSTILNNLDMLDPDKLEMVPSGGIILAKTTVTFSEGESVYDVLQRVCQSKGIHMESSWTPIYNSAYVEGIHNLYEFDCGSLSGWMYRVNGWYPNYGCSRYQLADGDVVEWRYTCDLGHDVDGAYAVGGLDE